jgi:hypothetical protein
MPLEIERFAPPTKQESSESDRALRFVELYTRPIIDDSRSNNPRIGTGVLVGIKDRLFVASAAHCLWSNPLLIMDHSEFPIPCDPTPFVNRGRVGNRDIGFLEIKNDLSVARLSIESLCPNPPPILPDAGKPEHRPTWIVGFPVDEVVIKPTRRIKLAMNNFSTHPVQVTEDEYRYVYPLVVGTQQEWNDTVNERSLNTPHGYSGSGVWVVNELPSDSLILPQNMLSLYALQSSWGEAYRVLHCIPIRHWIKLVYDSYTDLRELLAKQFPFLQNA